MALFSGLQEGSHEAVGRQLVCERTRSAPVKERARRHGAGLAVDGGCSLTTSPANHSTSGSPTSRRGGGRWSSPTRTRSARSRVPTPIWRRSSSAVDHQTTRGCQQTHPQGYESSRHTCPVRLSWRWDRRCSRRYASPTDAGGSSRSSITTRMERTATPRTESTRSTEVDDLGSGRARWTVYEAIYEVGRRYVELGVSVIVESAFRTDLSKPELQAMAVGAEVRRIACECSQELLLERFEGRRTTDPRRRAHPDEEVLRLFRDTDFSWDLYEPVELDGAVLRVDTTVGYAPSLGDIESFALATPRG